MGNIEAILHYLERWTAAIFRFKGRNTRRVEELRNNMRELIRLSHDVQYVPREFGVDEMPEEEYKIEAIIDRYRAWFDANDSYDEIKYRATQIKVLTEVYADYRTIKKKADALAKRDEEDSAK